MQISSIIDIVNGELKNSPLISFVTDIKINPNRVKQGDFFLVKDKNDINLAIQNGAFAILYDDINIEICDKEIAWIYVQNIDYALIRLMRYILTHHHLEHFLCDGATIELIKIYKQDFAHNVTILTNNMFENIIALNKIEEYGYIFTSNETFLSKITPQYKHFKNKNYKVKNLTVHSAFETTFSYKENFFNKLKLPSLYIDQFLDIYIFLEKTIDTAKLKNFTLAKPIFINKYLDILEFGKSDKFIIAFKDKALAQDEIEFFKKVYKYAVVKILLLDKNENISDIKKLIQTLEFNILLIVGRSYEDVVEIISQPEKQHTLF